MLLSLFRSAHKQERPHFCSQFGANRDTKIDGQTKERETSLLEAPKIDGGLARDGTN